MTAGAAAAKPDDPLTLVVQLKPLGGGVYTVSWRTVSEVDGHRATGSFAFGVGTSPGSSAGSASSSTVQSNQSLSPASVAGRWMLYIGLLVLAGAAFFGLVVSSIGWPQIGLVLPIAWILALGGTAIVLGSQIGDAGVELGQVLSSSFGPPLIERSAAVVAAGIGVLLFVRRLGPPMVGLGLVALGAAGGLLADVVASHAAAGGDPLVDVTVQALHVFAVGLWLGGLVGLLVSIRRSPGDATGRAAHRFSRLATVGIATVALTGLIRAISEVGTLDGLLTTDFGRLVIAKSAFLAVLAMLGAVNHFRNVPAAGRVLNGLRRVGSVELLVGTTILLLSASLVNVPPPIELAAGRSGGPGASPTPAAVPVVADGSDFGTSVRLHLEVTPGVTGFNTFNATVVDYDTGAPVVADGVTLRFADPARPDVGGTRLDLKPSSGHPGVFSATGGNLSIDGAWQVTALVVHGTTSVQVAVALAIEDGPQTVDANRVAGTPTIYTIHLTAGRTVQVYLDPDKAGRNDFHVTFFDASGNELATSKVTVTVVSGGAAPQSLALRTLEPGHVVGTLMVPPGPQMYVIGAAAPDGGPLAAQIQITPGT